MATSTDVLTCLRQELVNRGLVRKPGVAGILPPMHVEPLGGAPAPGERPAPENDDQLVITIDLSSTLGETQFDAFRRRVIIDVHYRSKGTDGLQRARLLDSQVVVALANRPDYGLGWIMGAGAPAPLTGGLRILSSTVYGGLGPVSRDPGQGAHDLAKYAFEVYA